MLSYGQQVEYVDPSKGLNAGFVYDVCQSQKGFLYIGLNTGLDRYDGNSIKHYIHDPKDSTSISPLAIYKIHEDERGYIWIATESGQLDVFNPRTENFHHLGQFGKQTSKYDKPIRSLISDTNGDIWLGLEPAKLLKLDLSDDFSLKEAPVTISIDQFQRHQFPIAPHPSTHLKKNEAIAPSFTHLDHSGMLWIKMNDGRLFRTTVDQPKLELMYQGNGTVSSMDDAPELHENVYQEIWYKDKAKWLCFKADTVLVFTGHLSLAEYHFVGFDESNHFLLLSAEELPLKTSLYKASKEALLADNAYLMPILQTDTHIPNNFFIDVSGTYWLSGSKGLVKFSPQQQLFDSYLTGRSLYGLETDKAEHFIFIYDQKVWYWEIESDTLLPFYQLYPRLNFDMFTLKILPNGGVWGIRSLEENGQYETDYFQYDKALDQLHFYPITGEFSKRLSFLRKMIVDEDRIWMFDEKLYYHDLKTFHTPVFWNEQIQQRLGNAIRFENAYMDSRGDIWLATTKGAIRVNPNDTADFNIYQNHPHHPASLSVDFIKSFQEDPFEPNRYIWIGTSGGGLNRLDRQTGACIHYTTANSDLPNDVVYQIQPDSLGRLWLSTNMGLSCFDSKQRIFRNYTKYDGLQEMEFNTRSSLKLSSGRLAFGGINGLTIFDPMSSKFQANTFESKALITKITINNEAIKLPQAPEFTTHLDLKHHQNTIGLQFAALDFSDPARNHFRYQLSHQNRFYQTSHTDWINLKNESKIQFTNLSPGYYNFTLQVSNADGIWNEKTSHLEILIHPIWWQSNWAFLVYFLLIYLSGWNFYRFQLNRAALKQALIAKEEEAAKLMELDQLKTNLFDNIAHELRTPLTLILEPLQQAIEQREVLTHLQLASRNAQKLMTLVNQLLDISKLKANSMQLDLRKGDVILFIRSIKEAFDPLAQQKNITLELQTEAKPPAFYFDKDQLEKILNNLLSNALKFTKEGHVQIKISIEKQNALVLEVQDTGIGIQEKESNQIFNRFYQIDRKDDPQQGGTGIGLALVKELVQLMEGEIHVESEVGLGTTFRLYLPMNLVPNHMDSDYTGISILPQMEGELQGLKNVMPAPQQKEHILLIEDDTDLRLFLNNILSPHYQILEAKDGAEGILAAQIYIPDLIVTDVVMPNKTGFEVVDALKTDLKTSHIPIIMLTAKSGMPNKLQGLRSGAEEYLNKPFHTEELLTRIHNLINIRKQWREKFAATNFATASLPIENTLSPLDQEFLTAVRKFIHNNLEEMDLSVEQVAKALFFSRSQLFRKLKALTNQTPSEFIRNYRLDHAYEQLKQRQISVSTIAFAVGMSEKYFSKKFKERFNCSPSEVKKTTTTKD